MSEIILARILKKITVNEENGCWEWQGNRNEDGYGRVKINYKEHLLHRLVFSIKVGEIPQGMCVLHRCDNRPCCNPQHLFLGTKTDNAIDRHSKGRDARGTAVSPANLTKDIVLAIRGRWKPGESAIIGREFSLHPDTILRIVQRKTWKHI